MFQKILVPIDFSSIAYTTFEFASQLACQHQSTILLLHVVDDRFPYPDLYSLKEPAEHFYRHMRDKAQKEMDELEVICPENVPIERIVLKGHPAQKILEVAQKEEVDLLILSTHGTSGLEHYLLGSVTEKVIRHATCPVLVLPAKNLQRKE